MSNSDFNRLSYIVSHGDYPVNNQKNSGDPVFIGGSYPYDVLSGEIITFDARKNQILASGDIATAKNISVAVGVGEKGSLAKELRYLAGEQFNLCNFDIEAFANAPSCGLPQILNVFFDGTLCGQAATIMFLLDDTLVRSRYNFNERAKYIFTGNPACTDCNSCNEVENGEKLRDDFVNQINQKVQANPLQLVHFQLRDISHYYQPFRAITLFNVENSLKTFCISKQDTDCENCAHVQGITGIIIDGVTTDFTYTTVPGDATKSTDAHVERVIEQINKALEASGGGAWRSKGIGKCCPHCIMVSSPHVSVLLKTSTGTIAPIRGDNPFTGQEKKYGFTVLVDPVGVDCLCDLPPDDVPNYYGRTLTAEFMGDGWPCNNTEVVEYQKQELPEGFGYFWQDRERYQHRGGSGKNFRNSDRYNGKTYIRPDKWSRTMSTTVDCSVDYCMYSLVTTAKSINKFNNALAHYNTDLSWVLVPERDATTRTSWETYLNALYERGICSHANVTCEVVAPDAQSVHVTPVTAAVTHPDTVQLTANVFPADADQTGAWSTSDAGVATVDAAGLVTTVAAGTVTITFTSTDGGLTDTSVITVS